MTRFTLSALATASWVLAACTSGSPAPTPGASATGAPVAANPPAASNAVICPEALPAVNLDTAPEYDSWLSMKGGGYGVVVREWHNGCSQQLSFPASAADNEGFDEAQSDYKPTHSPDGQHIAFFRRYYSFTGPSPEDLTLIGDNVIPNWLTSVVVIDADDGNNVRRLTDLRHIEFNPMWTRKKFPNQSGGESYRVTFTRSFRPEDTPPGPVPRTAEEGAAACWTDIDAQPGDEYCFTDVDTVGSVFAYSSLKDGRVLVRIEDGFRLALVTPDEQDPTQSAFQELTYDNGGLPMPLLHKITISPDETKIAYMKVEPGIGVLSPDSFGNALIAIADLDVDAGTISNEIIVSDLATNLANIDWYPAWSPTNKQLIFACSGNCPYWTPAVPVNYYTDNSQIVEYDLATQVIRRISHELTTNYRYPDVWGAVK